MTYRAWEQKPLDRAAVRELTAAIAEQAAAQLEEQAMDEAPWSDEKYKAVLAAQQKENALLAGILAARGITDPAEALTLLAGEEELSDPALLTDMDAACQRIWQAIDNGETIAVFGHERWRIENEGFNELCNAWNADHYFHHHPVSITGLWLMLFIAHALFHCFLRNIKPSRRRAMPVYLWAMVILAEYLAPLCSSA